MKIRINQNKKKYLKPKIKKNFINIKYNFNYNPSDLFATYCGQCSASRDGCPNCFLPPGCNTKSC